MSMGGFTFNNEGTCLAIGLPWAIQQQAEMHWIGLTASSLSRLLCFHCHTGQVVTTSWLISGTLRTLALPGKLAHNTTIPSRQISNPESDFPGAPVPDPSNVMLKSLALQFIQAGMCGCQCGLRKSHLRSLSGIRSTGKAWLLETLQSVKGRVWRLAL